MIMSQSMFAAYPLSLGRVHEVCGPSAASFALRSALHIDADVLWVREEWQPEKLNPLGFEGFEPARFIMAQTKRQPDTLAVAEEALRDGVFGLVVLEITAPLSLTAGRRLQLAAKAGNATGLCLIPKGMGSPAAETRWHVAPVFDPADSTLQRWQLIKNKSGTRGAWNVRWDPETRRIAVVPPAGD